MLLWNATLGKHKAPQSYKRYGLKTSTSDEVRQGCLHFFPISQSLSPKSACLTDREHPQATSCKPIYHGKPVICNFCSHSAKPAWRLQTKWYGKLCWNIVQGADEVGTESFFVSVDLLIHSEQYANTSMAVLIKRVTCKSSFFFFLGTKKSFKLQNLPSRTSTLFLSRRIGALVLFWTATKSATFLKNFQVTYILHIMLKESTLLKGNLCIYKCFIDVLYIFDRVLKKNWEMRPIWDR